MGAIPPPKFSISASPDSVNLRPNEEKIVKLQIHNNSTLNANLSISILDKKDEMLSVTTIPSALSLIPNGDNSLNIKVKNISNKQDTFTRASNKFKGIISTEYNDIRSKRNYSKYGWR